MSKSTALKNRITEGETCHECVAAINPTTLPTFADGDKNAALDFLRRFNQWLIPMTCMTSRMKAQYFGSCLLPLSAAESWFNALPDQDRSDIDNVIQRFHEKLGNVTENPKPAEIVADVGGDASDRSAPSEPRLAPAAEEVVYPVYPVIAEIQIVCSAFPSSRMIQ
jgi:hypothetical protein